MQNPEEETLNQKIGPENSELEIREGMIGRGDSDGEVQQENWEGDFRRGSSGGKSEK